MREILNGYNEIFTKWSSQQLKVNDIETEILRLEEELRAEKEENSKTVEKEVAKARLELENAEAFVAKLEAENNDEAGGELAVANAELRSCRDFVEFVGKTYEEQMRLWEVAYKRYSLRISNLRERLNIEETILDSYSEELLEYKARLQKVLKKVS